MTLAEDTKTQKSGDTRADVLAAAAKNFREKGYAAVSLREIAKTAGVTTGSLYYHFGSKDEVVREVLIKGHEHCHQAVEAALNASAAAGQPHETIIRSGIRAHLMALFGDDYLIAANIRIFSQIPHDLQKAAMPSRKAYEDCWRRYLKAAKDDGALPDRLDIDISLSLMFGAINWTIEWAHRDVSRIDEIADQITNMLTQA